MPRRNRPAETSRSEHWMRVAVNDRAEELTGQLQTAFGWSRDETVDWLSPVASDKYAEYYDQEFLDLLGINDLQVPLSQFWPPSGPRWDALGRSKSGKFVLVEAKAYIEEGVDYRSRSGSESMEKIRSSLRAAMRAYRASKDASWEVPFYQYANRLAHLYFLRTLNDKDALLVFLYFANAPDVPRPASVEQWQGAARLTDKCLGLGVHPYRKYVATVIWDVREMIDGSRKPGHSTKEPDT